MSGPLAGIKVVELAIAIQGPAAGLHFANMGAEVIKVEPPFGDASRYGRGVGSTLPEEEPGAQFIAMNKGKRSVVLDVHTELGQRAMHGLLETADVFITNYRSVALKKMGLDARTLTQAYPRLVVGHANGFGPQGDDTDKAMLDGAAQARGGLVSLTGEPGQTPMLPGAAVADHAGAMQLALGCVTALVARNSTGRGQVVETSSLGGQLWLQMWELQHSAVAKEPLTRDGPHHPNIKSQYGVYRTSDGEHILFVTAKTNEAWDSFWIYMERPEVLLMEDWNNPGKRLGLAGAVEGVHDIRALMTEAIGSKTLAELETFLYSEPEIIWERVRGHAEVLSDPQNLDNGYVTELELPIAGRIRTVGPLIDFSDTPAPPVRRPPLLSADTIATLESLGFTDEEIQSVLDHSEAVRAELYANLLGED